MAETLTHKIIRAHLAEGAMVANRVNFGIPPLRFADPTDCDAIQQGDRLELPEIRVALEAGGPILVRNVTKGREYRMTHALSPRQVTLLLAGGLTRFLQRKWRQLP